MSEKTERWAFARIRELETELARLRKRVVLLTRSREMWRERANDPALAGRWQKRMQRAKWVKR